VLGEARYNDGNNNSILHEIGVCKKTSIDVLHIISWDADHCAYGELDVIFKKLTPKTIECPGYDIDRDIQNQVDSLKLVNNYLSRNTNVPKQVVVNKLDDEYISGLDNASEWTYNNTIYNNKKDYQEHNNNSSIKLFRVRL